MPAMSISALNCTPCGLVRRALAMLYDALVIIAILMVAAAVVLPLGGGQHALRDPLYTLYLLCVWFVYLGYCWTHGGQTLGMRAWHLYLITETHGPITWRASLVRFVVSLVSAAAAGLGFIWCLWEKQGRTWHDQASATRVCRIPRPSRRARSDTAPQKQNHGNGQ